MERLVPQSNVLVNHELLLHLIILLLNLLAQEISDLDSSGALFLAFLLLGDSELFTSELPELREFLLLLLLDLFLSLHTSNLVLATLFNGLLHFKSSAFLLLKKLGGLVLGLSNLLVEHFLLLVAHLHQLLDLSINQFLFDFLLLFESLFLLGFLHVLDGLPLLSVLLDAALLFFVLESDLSLQLQQFFVGLLELLASLGDLLKLLKFLLSLLLESLFDLLLDELALDLLFLELFDVINFEVLELVLDVLGILHFLVVLFL